MITETEKAKLDIILLAFLLAYVPKQVIFDVVAEMLETL